jgi:diguanylate cyclase (GGDEF)-like protein
LQTQSGALVVPDHIVTLAPEEVARFLLRHRRSETLERYEPRLDHFLGEILAKANEFVPSEAGAIMLDDPRVKLFGASDNALTYIAAFGEQADALVGSSVSCRSGLIGRVYSSGRSTCAAAAEQEALDDGARSVLAVPVVVGNSVCGVLQLTNRIAAERFTAENQSLIEIFAGYISSSVQNTLDAIRAREVARRDHLTGLYNDRYFHYRLREEIRRGALEGESLALLFIDLDNFKQVNDRYGHLAGSRTLHEVGLLLQSECPPGAIAARYGGDEFVLILPGASAEKAEQVALQLQRQVAQTSFVDDDPAGLITISVGVACYDRGLARHGAVADQANALIRSADAAMYRAKAQGKNGVVFSTR